jgi:hypothetical protein
MYRSKLVKDREECRDLEYEVDSYGVPQMQKNSSVTECLLNSHERPGSWNKGVKGNVHGIV